MTTYVMRDGKLVEKTEAPLPPRSGPYISPDYAAYESPITPGKMVEGRRAHREELARHGCRVLEPSETLKARKARGEL